MNTYLSLDTFKGSALALGIDATGSAGNTRLLGLLEGMSRQVDRYTNRHFYVTTGTRFFSGDGSQVLVTPDLIGVTTLQEDTNWDGTHETGWSGTDYYLGPYNADPTSIYGRPYTRIEVNRNANGRQDEFLRGQRNYLVSGTFGYVSVTTTAASLSGSHDATATSIAFSGTSGAFEVGWTVLIDSEQMYVTAESGNSVTVVRGVNGSTAGTHASGTAIRRYEYPEPVVQAVAIQAGRMFKRAQGQYASESGMLDGQITRVGASMDTDVKQLLAPYRRAAMGGL